MIWTPPTKVAGKLRLAVRHPAFAGILGGRHMECAYYFNFWRMCRSGLESATRILYPPSYTTSTTPEIRSAFKFIVSKIGFLMPFSVPSILRTL